MTWYYANVVNIFDIYFVALVGGSARIVENKSSLMTSDANG